MRYADDTALCANSQEEAETLIGKVNTNGKARPLKLNVKNTKLLKVGTMQSGAGVTVDNEQIEVVGNIKYLGAPKAADVNCSKYNRSRNGVVQEKNARSCTDLERQMNKQRSENETSTLVGVDSSHIWC